MKNYPKSQFIFRLSSISVLIFMLLVSALVLLPSFFGRMESTLYDMRIRLAGNIPASSDIVLLNIDDASLEELGKWPWTEEYTGRP